MIGNFWSDNRSAILLGALGFVALWSMLAFARLLVVGVSHCSECDMTPYLMRGLGLSFLVALPFGIAVGLAARALNTLLQPYLGFPRTIVLLVLLTLGLAVLAVPLGLGAVRFLDHRIAKPDRQQDTGLGGTPVPPADLNR